ncbi:MAG: hypothetical protein NT020_03920 [Chloroflexales bacterium]|nr:hypothetical protein [Chloroflexales bacterium]
MPTLLRKQCPSCQKPWPVETIFCPHCTTSLHNATVFDEDVTGGVLPDATFRSKDVRIIPPRIGQDDEYLSMFRPRLVLSSNAIDNQRDLARVCADQYAVMWQHVRRLQLMAYGQLGVGVLAAVVLVGLVLYMGWKGGTSAFGANTTWHGVRTTALILVAVSYQQLSSAMQTLAQRDSVILQIGSEATPAINE